MYDEEELKTNYKTDLSLASFSALKWFDKEVSIWKNYRDEFEIKRERERERERTRIAVRLSKRKHFRLKFCFRKKKNHKRT